MPNDDAKGLAEQLLFFEHYNQGLDASAKYSNVSRADEELTVGNMAVLDTCDRLALLVADANDGGAVTFRQLANNQFEFYVSENLNPTEAAKRIQYLLSAAPEDDASQADMEVFRTNVMRWTRKRTQKRIDNKAQTQQWDALLRSSAVKKWIAKSKEADQFSEQERTQFGNDLVVWYRDRLSKLDQRRTGEPTDADYEKYSVSSFCLSRSKMFILLQNKSSSLAGFITKSGQTLAALGPAVKVIKVWKEKKATWKVTAVNSNKMEVMLRSWQDIAKSYLGPTMETEDIERFCQRAETQERFKNYKAGFRQLKMHAELSLVQYFIQQKFASRRIVIGVSKRCCFACTLAITAMREQGLTPRPAVSRSHNNCYGLYLLPAIEGLDGRIIDSLSGRMKSEWSCVTAKESIMKRVLGADSGTLSDADRRDLPDVEDPAMEFAWE
ncbi:hypothetical protein HKX48_007707 [Thoreauomyces humboldtii]|nr:hypothetical protein HKX48_007707 [Thoreauomyces humboldtii]